MPSAQWQQVSANGASIENLYGDLATPSFSRVSLTAPTGANSAAVPKREAKPRKEKEKLVALSVDIADPDVFRRRWESEITKECSTADTIDLKMSADDRQTLGISVWSLVYNVYVLSDRCELALATLAIAIATCLIDRAQ